MTEHLTFRLSGASPELVERGLTALTVTGSTAETTLLVPHDIEVTVWALQPLLRALHLELGPSDDRRRWLMTLAVDQEVTHRLGLNEVTS